MKSAWDDEYRAAVGRARGPYLRARRRVVLGLALSTPLLAAVTAAALAVRGAYPAFVAFALAGPALLVLNYALSILFLRRLRTACDSRLRELDAEYRGSSAPPEGAERR
jgi:hypothetical protein